ncbi:hypothetical protein [Streptomyces lunaelactis]|nr:hypothetical protein [Streptomyces lunaelactis]
MCAIAGGVIATIGIALLILATPFRDHGKGSRPLQASKSPQMFTE